MVIACIILAVALAALIFVYLRLSASCRRLDKEVVLANASKEKAEERLLAEKESAARMLDEKKESYERQIAEIKAACEQRIADERKSIGERFKAMAAEVLQSNSQQLDRQSRASVEAVLAPLKTQFEEFTKGFRECYTVESRDRLSMREEIKRLHELNLQVGAEAAKLTHALKGNNNIQGRWGEMVLKNILENSGLESGEWFVTQDYTQTEEGEVLRPDAVIHCPGQRDIIIDSKASLTSYFAYLDSDDEDNRKDLMKDHIRSIENHIKTLRSKDYQSKVGAKKGDFVFMFMPHEGAFLAAMHAKPDLWQNAYDSHVVLASPTHLITTLQLVEQMWKSEKQSINSQEIAKQGTDLLNSIHAFLTDLSAVGTSLNAAQKGYNSAMHRLQTGNNNVLRVAERLGQLGIKGKKELPKRFQKEAENED